MGLVLGAVLSYLPTFRTTSTEKDTKDIIDIMPKPKSVPTHFSTDDIPLGVCCNCGIKQKKPATGGFWINGMKDRWACEECKYGVPIPSHATACEWCTSDNVKWFQCNTYECERCNRLEIGKHAWTKLHFG